MSSESPLNQEKETTRVEAFSDGVFAIAITLLIIEIKVPGHAHIGGDFNLLQALLDKWPSFLAFFISFFTILIMWVNHHHLFSYIRRIDGPFLFINGFLLLTITFIPFPTALLAEYIQSPHADIAAAFYAACFILNCLLFVILWEYSAQKHRLIDKNLSPKLISAIRRNGITGLPLYLLAVLTAFFHVSLTIIICLLLAIFFAWAGSRKPKTS
jgi:uncharacterized membrane protein